MLPIALFSFRCENLPDTAWHVRRFELYEALSETYKLSIDLLTAAGEVDIDKVLGYSCELKIDRAGHGRSVYGIVERVLDLGVVGERHGYRLDVVPAVALRAQAVNTRFFQDKSVPDIVDEVLGKPLQDLARKLRWDLFRGDYDKRDYCVQYRETDLEFVGRLLQEEGIVFRFEHPPGGAEVMVFLDDTAHAPALELDGGARVLYVAKGVAAAPKQSVDTLTPMHVLRSTAVVQRDFDWLRPAESYRHERRLRSPAGGEREVYDHDDCRLFDDDGARRARRKHEQLTAQTKVFLGSSDVVEFIPGRAFELLGHVQHGLDRDYLLVRVRHTGDAPEEDMYNHGGGETRYVNEFECIDHDVPWRPPPMYTRPRAVGMQTGLVTGPEGEEVHTDEHGRIKVHFHWDRDSPYDDTSSCWIRVAQKWAGPGWGAMVLPRIGMEVVVEFVDGDPDRPIVTGCVYNGTNRPPYPLPEHKTKSTWKSDSSPGGGGFNELRFEDAKGQEEIYLHAQKNLNEVILNNMSTSVGNDQRLSVKNDRTKEIDGFESNTVHKDRSTTIDGSEFVHIKGSLNMLVDGGANLGRGPDPEKLGAGVKVTGEYNIIATEKLTITVGSSQITMDKNNITLKTCAKLQLEVGGSKITMVPSQIDISSATVVAAGGDGGASKLTLNAAADLKGGTQAKMHKGGSHVTLDGNANMKGTNAKVHADTAAELKGAQTTVKGRVTTVHADSDCTIEGALVKLNG